MDTANPQGSSPGRDGGSSSSPPPPDRGGGSSSTPPAARSQPEVIEVDDNKAVLAITPALVYDMKGEVYVLPADIVQAVDKFKAPKLLEVLYACATKTRGTGTARLYPPGPSGSSVRSCHNTRKFLMFCKTFIPVPGSSGSSGRPPYPYPELL